MVDTANSFGEHGANVQYLELRAETAVLRLRHRVGDENLVNGRGVDARNGIAAEDTVGQQGIYLDGAFALEQLGSSSDGIGRVTKIVDQDTNAVGNVSNQHHAGVALLGELDRSAFLVNEGKIHVETVGNGGGTLGTAGIRGDDHGLLIAGDVLADVILQQGLSVKVVDRYIEEPLILRIVEIHGDDVISASAGKQVGDKRTSLGDPLLIPGLGVKRRDIARLLVIMGGETTLRGDGALGGVSAGMGGQAGSAVGALGGGEAVHVIRLFLRDAVLGKLLGKAVNAIVEAAALGTSRSRGSRHALERVVLLRAILVGARERGTGLVVGPVRLARVGKQRHDGSDTFSGTSFASRDHDAEVNEVAIDVAGTGLNDIDILATNRVLNLAAAFTTREFAENTIAWRYAENIANVIGELGVGVAAK